MLLTLKITYMTKVEGERKEEKVGGTTFPTSFPINPLFMSHVPCILALKFPEWSVCTCMTGMCSPSIILHFLQE